MSYDDQFIGIGMDGLENRFHELRVRLNERKVHLRDIHRDLKQTQEDLEEANQDVQTAKWLYEEGVNFSENEQRHFDKHKDTLNSEMKSARDKCDAAGHLNGYNELWKAIKKFFRKDVAMVEVAIAKAKLKVAERIAIRLEAKVWALEMATKRKIWLSILIVCSTILVILLYSWLVIYCVDVDSEIGLPNPSENLPIIKQMNTRTAS